MRNVAESSRSVPRIAGLLRERGFTLVELLVVIGIIALLLSLLLPALSRARDKARALSCASNMRNIGFAIHSYAEDNQGFLPRAYSPWRDDRRPAWLLLAGPYLAPDGPWRRAWSDVEFGEQLLKEFEQFQCPSHPLIDEIPGGFVINAFKFETKPDWDPDGPVKLVKINNASNVIWVAEAADQFGTVDPLSGQNHVFRAEAHHAWHPEHLPSEPQERISDDRHRGQANLLFFDMSVRQVGRGTMTLEMFDDGVVDRATKLLLR